MIGERPPWNAILALGLTQNIGYGTLYYSFSILAPDMAQGFGLSTEWIFGALSLALLAGGIAAPWLGRALDMFGAGRVMTAGSGAAGSALVLCALAPGPGSFAGALVLTEMAANLVQYGAAFALLVQIRPAVASRSITYLTLIAGFASTMFWPITTFLHRHLSWQDVYLVYAAANILVCLPVHFWLSRRAADGRSAPGGGPAAAPTAGILDASSRSKGFALMVLGFSLQALVSSAILVHMVPLLSGLGLGTIAVVVGSLFGPSQVASRLINMLLGRDLPPLRLAVISAAFMTLSSAVLLIGAPSTVAALVFACLFGFGNGLFSIVSGTLPLALFGSQGYGSLQGKVMAARLIASAAAPFAFAFAIAALGISFSLVGTIAGGLAAVVALGSIGRLSLVERT
ncbi:arsenite efflux MFS transporter ArsK [Rhizobium sp. NTR19]|uniref:Arsenite efflux MFS transporter ArsK n=1 Tax=Neorhizobium turbinariae TaxID=2937795 RepID=A0ABT0ISI2_9HYPH|nr:arsenite efflux MFS transporter ArsK [Neorhizobium turbinariae]MCK8780848.1 arsenite efflux MFS transporter ArsK [Neorhizobium turbinariae]